MLNRVLPNPVHCVPLLLQATELEVALPEPTATHLLDPLYAIELQYLENIVLPIPVHVVVSVDVTMVFNVPITV